MDFSPWDLCDSFRLHEAACLMAGVLPISKRVPSREELPAQSIPYYVKLGSAYVLNWVAHNKDLPEDPKHPIESMLLADSLDGSGIPTLPEIEPLKRLTGEFVSREELHRWIAAMGINSAYSFAPVIKAAQKTATVETVEQRRARWLEWYGKGERGAVQDVYRRELLQNPKADRSFIGKQIKIAKEEKAEAKRAGTWGSQLVQAGKREG